MSDQPNTARDPNALDPTEVIFLEKIIRKKGAQLIAFAIERGIFPANAKPWLAMFVTGLIAVIGGMTAREIAQPTPTELVEARAAIRDARDYVLTFAPVGGEKEREALLNKLKDQLGE